MMDVFIATLQASGLAQGRFHTYPILAVIDSRQAVVILRSEPEHKHVSIESGRLILFSGTSSSRN
jgi:hypothetical protein